MQRAKVKKKPTQQTVPLSSCPSETKAISNTKFWQFAIIAALMISLIVTTVTIVPLNWRQFATRRDAIFETNDFTLAHLQNCAQSDAVLEQPPEQRPQEVLAYTTPWNRQGFAVAETYAHKLTFLSPVWYQLRAPQLQRNDDDGRGLELTGGHEFNDTWLCNVRNKSKNRVRIVPRVIWEVPAFVLPTQVPIITQLLAEEARDRGFDGYTLEFPVDEHGIFAELARSLKIALSEAIPLLSSPTLIVAIPAFQMPTRPQTPPEYHVTPRLLLTLAPHVSRFSLMTYDYAQTPSGAPISPLPWVMRTVEMLSNREGEQGKADGRILRGKMLLGLPWYGYAGGQAIAGHEFQKNVLDRAEHVRHVWWDEDTQEHVFVYSASHGEEAGEEVRATYPTPAFFKRRFALSRELGMAGVAVWEAGQGLVCFPMMW